jgi:hypothetical protein
MRPTSETPSHLSAHHLLLCGNMQITFPEPLTSVSGSGSRTLPSIHVNRYFTKLIQLLKNVANVTLPKLGVDNELLIFELSTCTGISLLVKA